MISFGSNPPLVNPAIRALAMFPAPINPIVLFLSVHCLGPNKLVPILIIVEPSAIASW